jgi:hypothetical protein
MAATQVDFLKAEMMGDEGDDDQDEHGSDGLPLGFVNLCAEIIFGRIMLECCAEFCI